MPTIQEREKAISDLEGKEMIEFRKWFEEFDADLWDRQFEEDVKAGKLDKIAEKAVTEHKSDKYTGL